MHGTQTFTCVLLLSLLELTATWLPRFKRPTALFISTETIRQGTIDVMDLVLAAHDRTDTRTARGMEITRSHAYLPCPPRGSNQTMS